MLQSPLRLHHQRCTAFVSLCRAQASLAIADRQRKGHPKYLGIFLTVFGCGAKLQGAGIPFQKSNISWRLRAMTEISTVSQNALEEEPKNASGNLNDDESFFGSQNCA